MFVKELTAFFFQFWGVVYRKKDSKVIVKQHTESLAPMRKLCPLPAAHLILIPFSASILHFRPEHLIKTQNEETSIPHGREWVKENRSKL